MAINCPICSNEIADDAAACPFCGFKLLGSTQGFKPVRLGDDDKASISAPEQRFDLKIVRGPQTGTDISLRSGKLTLGRDPKCDVFLNDMTVSRLHAELEVGAEGCVIKDKNSFNGVWVNDRMVDTCLLKSGDIIQIGVFCLVYRARV